MVKPQAWKAVPYAFVAAVLMAGSALASEREAAVVATIEVVDAAADAPCSGKAAVRGTPALHNAPWEWSAGGTAQGEVSAQQGADPNTYVFRLKFECRRPLVREGRATTDVVASTVNAIVKHDERFRAFAAEREQSAGRIEVYVTINDAKPAELAAK